MTLLYFLIWLRKREKIYMKAAHFNHHLRPGADEEESLFLRELCKHWQVPFTEGEEDVNTLAQTRKAGIEEAARYARYHFLHSERERFGKETNKECLLVLGHHRGDQAETVLLHMGRGTGLNGLSGMPYFKNRMLRPLLYTSREEIVRFASERELKWCEDVSNESGYYLRNRIRHDLIPLWNDILGYNLERNLSVLADNMQEETEAMEYIGQELLKECTLAQRTLNLKPLMKYPDAIKRRVIQKFLHRYLDEGGTMNREQFRQINETLKQLPATAAFRWGKINIDIKRYILTI